MGAPLQIHSSGAQGTIQKDPATLAQIHDMHEHERVGYATRVCLKGGDGIRTDPKSKERTNFEANNRGSRRGRRKVMTLIR